MKELSGVWAEYVGVCGCVWEVKVGESEDRGIKTIQKDRKRERKILIVKKREEEKAGKNLSISFCAQILG